MKKFYFKTLFFITSFIVFYLAVAPSSNIFIDLGYGDKVNHFVAFFSLSLLLNRSSSSYEKRARNVTVLFLFGVFIEFIQAFISYRSSDIHDLFADLLAILTFQAFYSIYRWIRYYR